MRGGGLDLGNKHAGARCGYERTTLGLREDLRGRRTWERVMAMHKMKIMVRRPAEIDRVRVRGLIVQWRVGGPDGSTPTIRVSSRNERQERREREESQRRRKASRFDGSTSTTGARDCVSALSEQVFSNWSSTMASTGVGS